MDLRKDQFVVYAVGLYLQRIGLVATTIELNDVYQEAATCLKQY